MAAEVATAVAANLVKDIEAASAQELLDAIAATPGQGAEAYADWASELAFKRSQIGDIPGETVSQPIYRWNYDPAADEAFSRLVDETSADGAWEAYKASDGYVTPGGSASSNPTVKASPQTAIKKPAAAGASAGGLLSMSLPTWTAAVAPLLGVAVGVGLYELSPELWEKVSRTLLPFCYDDSQALPVVTDEDGTTYVDKEAVEALKQLFEDEGIGQSEGTKPPEGYEVGYDSPIVFSTGGGSVSTTTRDYVVSGLCHFIREGKNIYAGSTTPTTAHYINYFKDGRISTEGDINITTPYTYDGKTVYVNYNNNPMVPAGTFSSSDIPANTVTSGTSLSVAERMHRGLWTSFYGESIGGYPDGMSQWNGQTVDVGTLPITKVYTDPADSTKTRDYIPVALPTQPGVSVDSTENPDPTTNSDPESQISPYIWPAIPAEQYPDGSETEETQDLDKNAPIPLPIPSPQTQPNPDADPSQPSDDPPQKMVDIIPPLDIGGNIPYPTVPASGDPQNVDGGVGGLVSVYNPTYSELQSFSQWLWVTYADATIDKIWNNPFDGIISLHELYATPNKGDRKYIKSGFLVSPVNCITVPNRYTEIECGSAIVPEYYGNYLDYSPYSKALCYLPFIGIVELNVDDIVGHAINIKYRVDSYSGACIALIECAKEGASAILYQFTGNCSVQMPIAGGTQAAIKAAQLSAGAYQNAYHIAGVAGLIGGIASGAAQVVGGLASMAGSAMGTGGIGQVGSGVASVIQGAGQKMTQEAFGNAAAVSQTVSAKSSVQHSGQFGESFGAMGAKRPYLIIKRPVQVAVPNYQNEYGYPAHKYVTIGSCTGYLRCRGVHVASARATDAELQLIEQELMGGVFVT
ncbi:MAG: hypothetical protein J6S67_24800 [Methanobrevibacter sp.]|nr:hypothetical protein [Methanobrevibacter sp.]